MKESDRLINTTLKGMKLKQRKRKNWICNYNICNNEFKCLLDMLTVKM